MAEKWIPIVTDEDDWEHFYDEESMRDNKDGTYSLVMKAIDNYSEEYIRKDKKKSGPGVLVRSVMSKVIISCSPFKALSMETNIYKNKDFTGFLISKGPDDYNFANVMNNTVIQKKFCGNNNAAPTPAPTSTTPKTSITDAKSQCSDIGFKKGTEKFGDCVLELMQ